jgi:glyoxylase-like metal-dependent hydrolase (beta-lactamase superfamily II)
VRPLDDGVTWIDEPHIREFYRCNIWHLRGRNRDLLVDSGWGVVSLREQIPLVTERPLVAVASHTHFDHIAGQHEFVELWVHRAEADILARPTRPNTLADPYATDDAFTALPPLP